MYHKNNYSLSKPNLKNWRGKVKEMETFTTHMSNNDSK